VEELQRIAVGWFCSWLNLMDTDELPIPFREGVQGHLFYFLVQIYHNWGAAAPLYRFVCGALPPKDSPRKNTRIAKTLRSAQDLIS
jgi:hypothetical protein